MKNLLIAILLFSIYSEAKFKWTVIESMSGKLEKKENLTFVEGKDYKYQNKHFLCRMNWTKTSVPNFGRVESINVGCSSKKQPETYFNYVHSCVENIVKKPKGFGFEGLSINLVEKLEGYDLNFMCEI